MVRTAALDLEVQEGQPVHLAGRRSIWGPLVDLGPAADSLSNTNHWPSSPRILTLAYDLPALTIVFTFITAAGLDSLSRLTT